MKINFQHIIREYWVELVVVPPSVVLVCYWLYGDVYFSSVGHFIKITLPWLFASIVSPICCHWVRNTTLKRFARLDDWPKRVVWSLIGYLCFTVGFAKLTYFVLSQSHYGNLQAEESHFYGLLLISSMVVLIIAIMYEGITYFDKWKQALTEANQLEKLSLETQFQSLQSQLNPHFLFNSFNVLSSLIAENPRRAEDFVDELSNVYRYLLRSNEQELATVREELHFIRSFFHLLQTRHDKGITLDIQVDKSLENLKMPALALQILLENAVKHNELNPEMPLHVDISTKAGNRLLVRNNLQQKATRAVSTRVGLDNLRQRYDLLGIKGFEVVNDGRYFTVYLPLLGSGK